MEKLFDIVLYICATTMVIAMTGVVVALAAGALWALWSIATK